MAAALHPRSTPHRPRLSAAAAGDDCGWFDDEIEDRRRSESGLNIHQTWTGRNDSRSLRDQTLNLDQKLRAGHTRFAESEKMTWKKEADMASASGQLVSAPTICRLVQLMLLISGVGILCSCSTSLLSPSTGLVGDDHIIVPGERVGPIRLGMSEQELLKLGTPEGPEPVPLTITTGPEDPQQTVAGIRYKFGGKTIWVYLERASHHVVQIDVGYHGNCGGYHTEEGIKCGSSKVYNVLGALGDPSKRRNWDFGNHPVMWLTYFNNHHSPHSLTIFNFDPGSDMSVVPVDTLQDIDLYEGEYGDFYRRAGN